MDISREIRRIISRADKAVELYEAIEATKRKQQDKPYLLSKPFFSIFRRGIPFSRSRVN